MKVQNKNNKGNPYHDEEGKFTSEGMVASLKKTYEGGKSEKTERYEEQIARNGFERTILFDKDEQGGNKMRRYYIDDNFFVPFLMSKKKDAILEELGKGHLFENHMDEFDKLGIDLIRYSGKARKANLIYDVDVIDIKTSFGSNVGLTLPLTNLVKGADGKMHLYDGWYIDKTKDEALSDANKFFLVNQIYTDLKEKELAEKIYNYKEKYGDDYLKHLEDDFIEQHNTYLIQKDDIVNFLEKCNIPKDFPEKHMRLLTKHFDKETGKTQSSPEDFIRFMQDHHYEYKNDSIFIRTYKGGLIEKVSWDPSKPFWNIRMTFTLPREMFAKGFSKFKI